MKFKTKNESSSFWAGFARQTIDFQHAVGELIDNALSATLPKSVGTGRQTATIELTLKENEDTSVTIQVADAGTGVQFQDLTGDENVFNLGYQPPDRGVMNEHGFGLKNALALMTSGFQKDFLFITKPKASGDKLYAVKGPIQSEMEATEVVQSVWDEDLSILKGVASGVKVVASVKREYFNTIYNRANTFETLVTRLAEHLGVMYYPFLQEGHEISIRYKSKEAAVWTEKKLPPIPTPFLENSEVSKETSAIEIEFAGSKYPVTYIRGRLDPSVRRDDCGLPWPYPLKIHYQGFNARCGITYVVRSRVLKTGVFREIWPEKAGDYAFNNFLGEIRVGPDFRTTNNKTDLDPHSELWTRLLTELSDDRFQPESATQKQSEEGLRRRIIKQISAVHGLTGKSKPDHKKVWDGGAEIDIWYQVGAKHYILETKVEKAQVGDVYQLVMYWDGLVEEGKTPCNGILVADDFPTSVEKAIDHVNKLKDLQGNHYNLEAKKISVYT